MTRPLLVFIGSSNVGPYINAMANSVSKYDVDHIALINVLDSPSGEQVDFADFANTVLWTTICGLVEGVYKWKDRDGRAHVLQVPEAKDCEAYKKLKDVFGNSKTLGKVNYQFLRDGLEKLKNTYGTDAIIDLS